MRRAAPPGSNAARGSAEGKGKMDSGDVPRDVPRGLCSLDELQELLQGLLQELGSGCTEQLLQQGLRRRQRLDSELQDRHSGARRLAQALAEAESGLARRFQDAQADVQRLRGRRDELDTELDTARERLGQARDRSGQLRQALQELQQQLQSLDGDEEEEEEQSLPPDLYVAQLYYEISRIDWDYSAEPGSIRGIHYGPDIAVPLDMDTSQHSGTFISDFLWGLVPTQWGPRRLPVQPRGSPGLCDPSPLNHKRLYLV